MSRKGYVYILRCSDGTYYTGVTNNVERRFSEHCAGTPGSYTHSRRPLKLVWQSMRMPILDAILLEKQIKRWNRNKKEALIKGEWDLLRWLSKPNKVQNAVKPGHPRTEPGKSSPSQ